MGRPLVGVLERDPGLPFGVVAARRLLLGQQLGSVLDTGGIRLLMHATTVAKGRRPDSTTVGGVLRIDRALRDAIVAHARRDHPDEACGVVAGPAGTDRPERLVEMTNAERSPTFYRFDSGEQLKVWREMDDRDEEPVVIYHSHTATAAYPSRTDIAYASEPGAHYVLVSTADPDTADFRSFRIVDGVVTEESVEVADIQRVLLGHTPADVEYDCR